MLPHKVSIPGSVWLLLAGIALGGQAIPNWPAPATWSPARAQGVGTLSETNPLPFIGVTPCRVADTRGNGFTGAYGPPALVANMTRSFTITGQCGIPASAAAVSFNFGALNVGGAGDLRVFPAGGAAPLVSTLNYNANTPNIANAAVVPLGTGGAITVQADAANIDLIIDVNGYYANTTSSNRLGSGEFLALFGSVSGGDVLRVDNALGDGGYLSGAGNGVVGAGVVGSGVLAGTFGLTGVYGFTLNTANDSAGVAGVDSTGSPEIPAVQQFYPAGVRGDSKSHPGVIGVSTFLGTAGSLLSTTGAQLVEGNLGSGPYNAAHVYGVYSFGDFGGTGAKFFIEAHPTDPSKVIRYVALEGPEAGTYFRGRARFSHGLARIEVPESFRLVTDEEGLTVQITPIGEMASYAVQQVGLNEIIVEGSKDVEFFYTVNGVRQTFKDLEVISQSGEYMPRSADARMPEGFSAEQKRRLIANGTYNPDGTVNMDTAERVGWMKIWADREAEAQSARQAQRKALPIELPRVP